MYRILMFLKRIFSSSNKVVDQLSESRNNEKPIEENLDTLNEIKQEEVFEKWENPEEMECYTLKDATYDSLDWYKYSNNKVINTILEIEKTPLCSKMVMEIIAKRCIADDLNMVDVSRSLNKLFVQGKISKVGITNVGRKRTLWQVN